MAKATTTSTGVQFAKLVELGDTLIGALASDPGKSRRQARNFETKEPAVKGDGTPILEEILYLIVMPGSTAKRGEHPNFELIEPGEKVRFAVSGFKWGQLIQARKELPARGPFGKGVVCSGDVVEITLAGWSAETKNPTAAQAAGFTVVDGRIQLKSQEEKDKYVLHQSRAGGNTNPGRDFEITTRRPTDAELVWEKAADEYYDTKPWEQGGAGDYPAVADSSDPTIPDEPF